MVHHAAEQHRPPLGQFGALVEIREDPLVLHEPAEDLPGGSEAGDPLADPAPRQRAGRDERLDLVVPQRPLELEPVGRVGAAGVGADLVARVAQQRRGVLGGRHRQRVHDAAAGQLAQPRGQPAEPGVGGWERQDAEAQEAAPTVVVEFVVTGRKGAAITDLKPTELEVRQARLDLNTDRAALLRQETTYLNAKATFNQLLVRPLALDYTVEDSIVIALAISREQLVEEALARNASINFAEQELTIAGHELREIRAEHGAIVARRADGPRPRSWRSPGPIPCRSR